jgi:hypothetical protein
MKEGSSKRISIAKRVVPQLWGLSNGTFDTDKVGDIEIYFVEYSASKKVRLQPDIVGIAWEIKHQCVCVCVLTQSLVVRVFAIDGVSTHRPVLSPHLEAALNKIHF